MSSEDSFSLGSLPSYRQRFQPWFVNLSPGLKLALWALFLTQILTTTFCVFTFFHCSAMLADEEPPPSSLRLADAPLTARQEQIFMSTKTLRQRQEFLEEAIRNAELALKGKYDPQCKAGWIRHEASCYRVSQSRLLYNESAATCREHGARLAFPGSLPELGILRSLAVGGTDVIASYRKTLIGSHRVDSHWLSETGDDVGEYLSNLWDYGHPGSKNCTCLAVNSDHFNRIQGCSCELSFFSICAYRL